VSRIDLNEETKTAKVYLEQDQVSLAIGKGGSNIKLAGSLTGYEIDVLRDDVMEEVEDIDLDEFSDEIEEWVIDQLKDIGCDTARSVLNLTREELQRRTDLEVETIDAVLQVLINEFEEDEL
jgi:N utilization substance protein A